MLSFTTNGNFIDFKYTEDQYPFYVHQLTRLHNTSKCITWGYSDDTTRISFTIDDETYDNIPITSIYFDGVVMSAQADFKTNIESMFPGLATAATLVSIVTLTDAQIKSLNSVAVTLIDAPGANKAIFPQSVYIRVSLPTGDAAKDYGNINAAAQIVMSVGFGAAPIYFLFDEAVNGSITNLLSPGAGVTALHAYSGISSPTSATTVVGQTGGIFDSDVDNVALSMYMNNSSGALNGGDASNSMKVTIYYVIVDL